MKKIIVLTLIIASSFIDTQAQGLYVTTAKKIELLKQNGVKVVIADNKFGQLLKKTITEHWKATKYEFITEKEVKEFENKKEVNLLGYFKNGEFESGKHYLYGVPFFGITNKYIAEKDYKVRDKDAYAYILYAGDGVTEANLESTILLYVKALNSLVNTGGGKAWMAQIKKNGSAVKKKKIYAVKEDLEPSTTDIKKKYSGIVKKVERDIYNSAIMNTEDVHIFLDVRTGSCYLFAVIDKDGFPYYTMIGSTMTLTKAYQLALFKALGKL